MASKIVKPRQSVLCMGDFMGRFGYSNHRRFLADQLFKEFRKIVEKGWAFRAYVYGSMVNSDKLCPGDVDLLLCISLPINESWTNRSSGKDLHIFSWQLRPSIVGIERGQDIDLVPCLTASEMVKIFNRELTLLNEGFQIAKEQCVEVAL